jgi:hypothetical protein
LWKLGHRPRVELKPDRGALAEAKLSDCLCAHTNGPALNNFGAERDDLTSDLDGLLRGVSEC